MKKCELRTVYLVAAAMMVLAAILVLFDRNYLASSTMLVASGFAVDHYRLAGELDRKGGESR